MTQETKQNHTPLPDLEYITTGLFTRFIPNTPAGEEAWRVMAADNNDSVLSIHAKSVIAQLKTAGYSVRQAKPVKPAEIDSILTELGM